MLVSEEEGSVKDQEGQMVKKTGSKKEIGNLQKRKEGNEQEVAKKKK